MSNSISGRSAAPVELDRTGDRSILALVLAVLSVPGSIVTWDVLPGGGFVWGAPLAVAAVGLGLASLRANRGRAIAAVVIAGAMIAMMVIWTIASLG
jgi:hypothetical protein